MPHYRKYIENKWFIVPHCRNYQWYWGYRKVRMKKLPYWEKQKLIERNANVEKTNNT
jgi:hypothetical protein